MSNQTVVKLKFLKEFVDKHFPDWTKEYGQNVVGAHVGHKEISNKRINRYSIVFHVLNKGSDNPPNIPDIVQVEIPGQGLKKIPTDVIEVGEMELEANLGSDVKPISSNYGYGSVGFYGKRLGHHYACSNMHVVAANILENGQNWYYKHPSSQSVPDVKFNPTVSGFLEEAYFDDIDAAIVRVESQFVNNHIPQFGNPNGFVIINMHNLNYYKSQNLKLNGATSGFKNTKIIDIGINKQLTKYNQTIFLTDLIRLQKCSQKGDSGGPVFITNTRRIVGIIVGSDNQYSYVIPAHKILNRFNLKFLT